MAGKLPTVRFLETQTGRPRGVWMPLLNDHWVPLSADGHYRGTPRVERELVFVVQTDQGQETLTPEEFATKYGWKNDPERVRLTVK